MFDRDFYLAAYDVSCPRRLADALMIVRGYAIDGQKSVYEIQLTETEKRDLLYDMTVLLDGDEDRFFLLLLDPRARIHALGVAVPPIPAGFFYVA